MKGVTIIFALFCGLIGHAQTILTADGLALFINTPSGPGILVDSFQDWHTGNNGDFMSNLILQNSATGDNNWTTNQTVTTWRLTNGPSFTLRNPINVNGTVVTTTSGKAAYFNIFDEIDRPEETFGLNTPAGLGEMKWGFYGYANIAITNSTGSPLLHDLAQWNDTSFVVPFHIETLGDNTPYLFLHYSMSNNSSSPATVLQLQPAKWYWYEAFVGRDGFRSVSAFDPANSYALVGGRFGYGGPTNKEYSHPQFTANYLPIPGGAAGTGIVAVADSWVNYSHVDTNQSPWIPNAPTSVSVIQSFDHEATIQFVDSNSQLSPYMVSNKVTAASNSTGTNTGDITWTNIVVTNLANGTTYNWDAFGVYPPSFNTSSRVAVGPLTVAEIDVTNGLVGEWRMNGSFNDSTVNAINGSGGGSTAPGFDLGVGGTRNHSVNLNGIDQYISLGNPSSLHLQAPMTLMAWVKLQETPGSYSTIYGSHGVVTDTPVIFVSPGQHVLFQAQGAVAIGESTVNMPTNTWTHVAVTYDVAGNWVIYQNGVNCGSGNHPTTFTYGNLLQIGWGTYDGGSTSLIFKGLMEDFRIYNRSLSSSEITTVYSMGGQ